MAGGWFPITYDSSFELTPHASNPNVFDGVWVGGTGNLTVTLQQGSGSVEFLGIPAGTVLPIRTRLVTAATATDLIGLRGPSPAFYFSSCAVVTDGDTAANVFDAFYVNATGGGTRLDIMPQQSSVLVSMTVAVGQFIPIRSRLVPAATTATVVGLKF